MNLIDLKDITKVFVNGNIETKALNGVDLTINNGQFTAIVGASGSGKTTLLNIIGTLDTPTTGTFKFLGNDVDYSDKKYIDSIRAENLGFIFQNYNLLPVLNAVENVELAGLSSGNSPKQSREQAEFLLDAVGLSNRMHHKPNELSGGQQQRVSVARALMGSPKLILADEPTANLDSVTTHKIIDLMQKLNQDLGIGFLFSTHDEHLMHSVKNIIKIEDGKVI